MKSALPKVLHPLLGRPMLAYPVQAALDAGAARVVIVRRPRRGAGRRPSWRKRFDARVRDGAAARAARHRRRARAAAHSAAAELHGLFLIFYGDAPLLTRARAARACSRSRRGSATPLALLTATLDDPTGYGRILRDAARPRDRRSASRRTAAPRRRAIRECNPGVYAVDARVLPRRGRQADHRTTRKASCT